MRGNSVDAKNRSQAWPIELGSSASPSSRAQVKVSIVQPHAELQ